MTRNIIDQVDGLYSTLVPNVKCVAVEDEAFFRFHLALTQLVRYVNNNEISDEYLLAPTRRLRHYRFQVSCAPLDYDNPFFWQRQSSVKVRQQLAECAGVYPDAAHLIREIVSRLDSMIQMPASPLRSEVARIITAAGREDLTLLVCEARFVAPAQNALTVRWRSRSKLEVLCPSMLRDLEIYDRVVMIGTPRYYEEFVFNACRISTLEIVNFNWLHDEWKPTPVFGDLGNVAGKAVGPSVSTRIVLVPGWTRSADLLPSAFAAQDLSRLVSQLEDESLSRTDVEKLDLRLFILENGLGVFLEELDSARIRVLRIAEGLSVETMSVNEISEDSFLLLRTRGGGDYIEEIADRLMGDSAGVRRAQQDKWKSQFRELVRTDGLEAVRHRLTGITGDGVSAGQIRYWMWSGSIGPQKPSHFNAVLTVLDLSPLHTQYQQDVDLIRHFHQLAGREIARRLDKIVEGADPREITKTGIAEYSLDELDGGSITAIRVVRKTETVVNLPARRARQLFDLEGMQWQE